MSKKEVGLPNWFKITLGVIVLLFLFRIAGRLAFLFLIMLMVVGLGFGIYMLWKYYQSRQSQKVYTNTLEGKAAAKMQYCDEQIRKNEVEAEQVKKSLLDLQKQLGQTNEISDRKKEEAKRLLKEFESELRLRRAKIDFFRAAKRKLEQIHRNKLLDETLSEKEEELQLLKEGHYEDLADMEALRSDMELETLYLDTIETLSLKMNQSKSMESVQSLQRELEEMTKGLE